MVFEHFQQHIANANRFCKVLSAMKDEQGDRCPYYEHLSPYPLGDIHGFLATIMMRTSIKRLNAKIAE